MYFWRTVQAEQPMSLATSSNAERRSKRVVRQGGRGGSGARAILRARLP